MSSNNTSDPIETLLIALGAGLAIYAVSWYENQDKNESCRKQFLQILKAAGEIVRIGASYKYLSLYLPSE